MAALDLVDWPAGRTLSLSGSAAGLRIPFALRNDSAEPVRLAEASLADVLAKGGAPLRRDPVPIQVSLAPNAVTRASVRLRLDPATPPGRYEGQVKLAGLARAVAIDVLPEAKLDVRPSPLLIDAAAGSEQRFTVGFENRGNVPLTIDLAGTYPLGEELPIPPHRLEEPGASDHALAAIFDQVLGRVAAPALKPFGSAQLSMPGGAEHLQPGEARTALVAVRLPHGLAMTARYHLFAPLYAADLHIVVVTATKHAIRAKSAPRTKGAAA